MAYHTEPDDSWFSHQSTHSGFDWYTCGEELSQRDDVWYLLANPSVVQVKDWPYRLDADLPCIFVVSRMRASDDARLPGVQFLQFNSDCILRSRCVWNSRNAHLRGLRQCR